MTSDKRDAKFQYKNQLEENFLKDIHVGGKTTRHSIRIMMLASGSVVKPDYCFEGKKCISIRGEGEQ